MDDQFIERLGRIEKEIRQLIKDVGAARSKKRSPPRQARADSMNVSLMSLVKNGVPKGYELPLFLGRTTAGDDLVADLSTMPHVLVGGASGQGKTTLLKSIICGLIANYTRDEVQMILYDEKKVDFVDFRDIPHFHRPHEESFYIPSFNYIHHDGVFDRPDSFCDVVKETMREMECRLTHIASSGCRNIREYNSRTTEKMPYVVIVADEVDSAVTIDDAYRKKEIAVGLSTIALKGAAAGVHLVLGIRHPTAKVLNGASKANIPGRISFKMSNATDSRAILDQSGAENLVGRGEMLFLGANEQLIRATGAVISQEDIVTLVSIVEKSDRHGLTSTDVAMLQNMARDKTVSQEAVDATAEPSVPSNEHHSDDDDCKEAIVLIRNMRRASISLLQRKLGWGYNHAAHILDLLREQGVIGSQVGTTSREVSFDKISGNAKLETT